MTLHDLTHLSPDEAQEAMKAATKQPHKYRAERTEYGGQVYPSKAEANRAAELEFLKLAGAIRDWRRGTRWVLVAGATKRDSIYYVPDFEVWDTNTPATMLPSWVEDVKGYATPVFRLKQKLWKLTYTAIPLKVIR
jgi:hypothetical protein